MLANQLSLQIDEANNDTPVQNDFDRHNVWQNRSSYIGPNHTQSLRELLAFYRTEATKTGNFKGTSKCAIKKTLDIEVLGVDATTTLTVPLIGEVSFSMPVGCTTADLVKLRQTIIALLDDDTFMATVMESLEI